MERFCFTFTIKPGQEAEYQRRHDEIWPAMVTALKDAGISNYTLFRRGTTVIGYCECEPSAEVAFGRIGATEVNARWQAWLGDVIDTITDADGRLFAADEVWHLD